MTQGEHPTERLSARRQFVLVLRVVVEVDGKVNGELVDPLSERRQRFTNAASLVGAVQAWIADAVNTGAGHSGRQTKTNQPDS
jgi:hypothetical protein